MYMCITHVQTYFFHFYMILVVFNFLLTFGCIQFSRKMPPIIVIKERLGSHDSPDIGRRELRVTPLKNAAET